ncbi:MAG: redox-sensing transcriptional repressor Rex [Spirochaetes bacterium]|nr:redox-sensing transcriptional repressor Rex [Spirochaetota bacterium]
MNINKNIIIRLSKYKNSLKKLKTFGFKKVFSDNIADSIGVTPSQVRKDFSVFGIPGNKKGGYTVDELIEELNKILGKNEINKIIVVGAGNLGTALIKYEIFRKEGIKIVAGFDIDPDRIDENSPIPIFHINKLSDFIKSNDIHIGIITVPENAAQSVFDIMITSGIKGVLNFSPFLLKSSEEVVINNIYLQTELESLIYYVNALKRN